MAKIVVVCVLLSAVIQATHSAPDSYKRTYRADRDLPIKYPGPVEQVDRTRYEQTPVPESTTTNTTTDDDDVPKECRDLEYCTVKPKNYPDYEIKQLFKNKKVALPPPDLMVDLIIGNRQGDPNEEDNCPSIVSYDPIYKMKHNSKWQTVVQAPDLFYEQKVRMERCTNRPGKACFTIATFPNNVRTKCVQKVSTWKVQILDDKQMPTIANLDIPSCCSCHYEYIDN